MKLLELNKLLILWWLQILTLIELKTCFGLGNEVDGISDEILSDLNECLEIPQLGTKHSLMFRVCDGIVMWEFF